MDIEKSSGNQRYRISKVAFKGKGCSPLVDAFQFWMECCISFTVETGIAFVDLDEGITRVEVGVVIVTGKP